MRGVTRDHDYKVTDNEFQLTRLMRGVTGKKFNCSPSDKISTHTPHARRDSEKTFSILSSSIFQLTRLMRGVTKGIPDALADLMDFNSHASCEA